MNTAWYILHIEDFQSLALRGLCPSVTLLQEKQIIANFTKIHVIKYHIHPNIRHIISFLIHHLINGDHQSKHILYWNFLKTEDCEGKLVHCSSCALSITNWFSVMNYLRKEMSHTQNHLTFRQSA